MRFPADLAQILPALLWIRGELSNLSLDKSTLNKIELVSEEALVNIVEHAYQGLSGDIELVVSSSPKQIEIVIKDQGPPFDPLNAPIDFDPTLPLEERKLGGLGIPMIRKFMDQVLYKRENNQNVLTLIKKRH